MNSPPDFHITETPTLHFVATEDEQRLSQDLQARLDESLGQAEEKPEVKAAAEAARAAGDRLERMRKAERMLHQHARESNIEMAGIAEKALGSIIESAAEG
jgi:UTP:GlnB (protein PII) uridylyltransferase